MDRAARKRQAASDAMWARLLLKAGLTQQSSEDPDRNIPVPLSRDHKKFLSAPRVHRCSFTSRYNDTLVCSWCGKLQQ